MINGWDFSKLGYPYTRKCFSSVESLFAQPYIFLSCFILQTLIHLRREIILIHFNFIYVDMIIIKFLIECNQLFNDNNKTLFTIMIKKKL